MKSWYLVTTKTNEEAKAEENLFCQGFEAYAPKFKVETKDEDTPWDLTPAFPNYMFVSFDPAVQSAGTVNSTFGVSKLVAFGDVLVKVSDEIVTSLKNRINRTKIMKFSPTDHSFGQQVDIFDGPFSSADAIFQEPDGMKRSILLVNMLGNQHQVSLSNKSFA